MQDRRSRRDGRFDTGYWLLRIELSARADNFVVGLNQHGRWMRGAYRFHESVERKHPCLIHQQECGKEFLTLCNIDHEKSHLSNEGIVFFYYFLSARGFFIASTYSQSALVYNFSDTKFATEMSNKNSSMHANWITVHLKIVVGILSIEKDCF